MVCINIVCYFLICTYVRIYPHNRLNIFCVAQLVSPLLFTFRIHACCLFAVFCFSFSFFALFSFIFFCIIPIFMLCFREACVIRVCTFVCESIKIEFFEAAFKSAHTHSASLSLSPLFLPRIDKKATISLKSLHLLAICFLRPQRLFALFPSLCSRDFSLLSSTMLSSCMPTNGKRNVAMHGSMFFSLNYKQLRFLNGCMCARRERKDD